MGEEWLTKAISQATPDIEEQQSEALRLEEELEAIRRKAAARFWYGVLLPLYDFYGLMWRPHCLSMLVDDREAPAGLACIDFYTYPGQTRRLQVARLRYKSWDGVVGVGYRKLSEPPLDGTEFFSRGMLDKMLRVLEMCDTLIGGKSLGTVLQGMRRKRELQYPKEVTYARIADE